MTLKVKALYLHIYTHPRSMHDAPNGDPSFNPSEVIAQTSPVLDDFDLYDPQMTLKVKVKFHQIESQARYIRDAPNGDPSLNPSEVIARTSPFLADFDLYDPQMTLKAKVKFHHIQSHPRSTYNAPIGKIW